MKLALFDFNNLLYKGCAVNKDLTHDGIYTGGLFMFLTQLCTAINAIKPDRVVVLNDSPPYKRLEMYPSYKGDRKTDEDLKERARSSRGLCNELLKVLGITTWSSDGLEADDLMGIITTLKNYKEFTDIVMCSNDDDLYQLLKPSVCMWRGAEKGYYTLDNFIEEFNIQPYEWASVCALKGTHNGLSGFYKIGIKRALGMVQNPDKFTAFFEKPPADGSSKMMDTYEKFVVLVKLPYEYPKFILNPRNIGFVKYVRNEVTRWLSQYNIKLTSQMSSALFE